MQEARVIRSVRFRATHSYRRREWTEEQNRAVFGGQAEEHSHDWRVEVHVIGTVDPTTGWAVDLGELDGVLADLFDGWDGGDVNAQVPEVAEGTMMPSTERLAGWVFGRLAAALPDTRVVEVRVFESPELGSAYPAGPDHRGEHDG